MNAKQRKRVLKITDLFKEKRDELNSLLGDEQSKIENIPENFQGGEKYCQLEEDICGLEDALMNLDEVIDMLDSLHHNVK